MSKLARNLASALIALALSISFAACSGGDDKPSPEPGPGPGTVSVTAVNLSPSTLSLTAGGATGSLTATLAPVNATNRNVTWSSSATSIATVSGSGLNATVTPVAAGSATITVSTTDGGFMASCDVTVERVGAVTGVTIPGTVNVATAGTYPIHATIQPATATNKLVDWTTSNAAVATVDETTSVNSVIRGRTVGTALITVTTRDGAKTSTCTVTVTPGGIAVTGVTIDPTTLAMWTGEQATVLTALIPVNAANQLIDITSSDTSKVTIVRNGRNATVTAVAAGTAAVTVKTDDGNFQATCAVAVIPPPPQKVYVGGNFGMILDGAAQSAYDGCDVYAVEIVGSDVHACGVTKGDAPRAVLWVNGTRSDLPMTSGATVSGAHGICAVGSDVYVAGWEAPSLGNASLAPWDFRPPATSEARLWKNGQSQDFIYPRSQAGTIQHTGSYGLCLAPVWEPSLDRYRLWMGGNLKMSDGSSGAAVWIADPGTYGYTNFLNLPPNSHFWSLAAEPAPSRKLWAICPEWGLLYFDVDSGYVYAPYDQTFTGYSVKYLNGKLYAAGFLRTGTYPAAYMVDGVVHEIENGTGTGYQYTEAWDINLGPGGGVHVCGGDFFGTSSPWTITGASPRLWTNGAEVNVPGWTGDKTKGLAYAVAATAQ
jgi:uncharacterized protein YjdB